MPVKIEFNEDTYRVLKCGMPDEMGYYNKPELVKIAKELMKQGYFINSPEDQWWQSGWKCTPKGIELFEKYIKLLHAKHGHQWKTRKESNPDLYDDEDDEYDNAINEFAMCEGNCNGPECKKCGFSFCMHCTSEFDISECSHK